MTTNQEWLFSLTLKEYLEWMESEHYEPKDDVSGYGADFNVVEPNFDNIKAVEMDASRFEAVEMDASHLVTREPDSREKLEADIINRSVQGHTILGDLRDGLNTVTVSVDVVRGWLDRQAEITREEADAGCKECFTERHKRERELGEAIDGLTEQVESERRKEIELAAERDQLKNAINELQEKQPYCYNPEQPLDTLNTIGQYIDELTAERDNLKELNEYHAHQYDLASEDIDRMHAQVDELIATIDKLQKQANELVIR